MASTTVAGSQGFTAKSPCSESVADRSLGHAGDVHGGAGHLHRVGGAALYRRQPVGHQRRSHLGADQLPGGQCRHSAGQHLVLAEIWPQAFPDYLHRHLHGFVVRLRSGNQPVDDSAGARGTRRGRRRAAAVVAVDPAGKLSARQARHGAGGICTGRGGSAGARSNPGRISHRYVLLALGLLHQHSDRDLRHLHDPAFRYGSALHQERQARQDRRHRTWTAGSVAGFAADHSRQGPGRRLVRRHLDPLDHGASAGDALSPS